MDEPERLRRQLTRALHGKLRGAAIIIVEGIYSSRRELTDVYDFRIWVDTPRETRLARGLARDGEEARKKWEEDWMPCEDRYVLEHRPQDHADAVVNGAAV